MLLSILFPIGLVFEFSHLHGSDLFDLIIVNDENLSFIGLVLQLSLGSCTSIWLLEADKSIGISGRSFFKSNVFNFSLSSGAEDLSELLFSPVVWEILNVEIDSLL